MGLISSAITKLFGTHSERELKAIQPMVTKIESLADQYHAMSDAQLRGFLTRCDIFVQMRQFGIQSRCLNTIQTTINTDAVMMITNHHSMVGYSPHERR